jgi:hypothetical protein
LSSWPHTTTPTHSRASGNADFIVSGGLKTVEPQEVAVVALPQAFAAPLGTQTGSPGVIADQAEFSVADGTTIDGLRLKLAGICEHRGLL